MNHTDDDLRRFFNAILPVSTGDHLSIHWGFDIEGRKGLAGRAYKGVDELIGASKWANRIAAHSGVYHCVSSQLTANGKKANRLGTNITAIKSLFLDIDAGEGKSYSNKKEILPAYAQFLKDSGFPPASIIVDTGHGLHFYWPLTSEVSPDDWQPVADALAEATRQHDLKCDTQVTVDRCRILRTPGTMNLKHEPHVECRILRMVEGATYDLDELKDKLEPYKVAPRASANNAVSMVANLPQLTPLQEDDELAAGIPVAKRPHITDVAAVCPFVEQALTTGGKDFQEPLWRSSLMVAVFTEGGRNDAHNMSSGHADYDEASVDEKYDRAVSDQRQKDLGWPSCAAIQNAGCTLCKKCIHVKDGKSPFNFVVNKYSTAPAVYVPTVDLPEGYVRDADNFVSKIVVDMQGGQTPVRVFDYPVREPWLKRDPWVLHFTVKIGLTETVVMLPNANVTKDQLFKTLQTQGMMIKDYQQKAAREFFMGWIAHLQTLKDATVSNAPFGWHDGDSGGIEGFSFGGRMWTEKGDRPSAISDPIIQKHYTPKGDIQPWFDSLALIEGRPELEALVATAFGAPLIALTGHPAGALYSNYSQESGVGKSTALKIGCSVWGHPINALQGVDDTSVSVMNRMGALKSLPLYWDELQTEEAATKFTQLIFSLTRGRERSRMTSDITQRETGGWKTLMVSASNDTLIDYITSQTKTTTAGIFRIFEVAVPKSTAKSKIHEVDAQHMSAKLDNNYGHIGLRYAQWLGANRKEIQEEVSEFAKKLWKAVNAQQDERFWIATMTCVCMGATFANRLGYTNFDEIAINKLMLKTLKNMRNLRKDTHVDLTNKDNVTSTMTQFFKAASRHTLYTNRIHISKGKPRKDFYKVVRDTSKLESVHLQFGAEDKIARFSTSYFTEWLGKKGVSRQLFNQALSKQYGMKPVVGILGAGTQFTTVTSEYLIQIDLAGTDLAAYASGDSDDLQEPEPEGDTIEANA
jgi:hypothetical protein